VNTAVAFPTGIGVKGNEGVAGFTARTRGAIGYVEPAYGGVYGLGSYRRCRIEITRRSKRSPDERSDIRVLPSSIAHRSLDSGDSLRAGLRPTPP
jgi:hypothetical protein